MELLSIAVEEAVRHGRVRLCGTVAYEAGEPRTETVWFEVPEALAGDLSRSGNPWVACLLPVAVSLGEPLRIRAFVDPVLLRGVRAVMEVWARWYPHLTPVPVEGEGRPPGDIPRPRRTAAFFSGGVDSFFTVLSSKGGDGERIDDLWFVRGFYHGFPEEVRLEESLRRASGELGHTFLSVATNLRGTRFREAHWGNLAHGAALASVALALEERCDRVLIPSTYDHAKLQPWGSHPETDPRFSTSRLAIVHHGAEFTRVEKTKLVARSDVALRSLRVCPVSPVLENCGRCNKCLRTMLTLDLLGALEHSPTFLHRNVGLPKLARVYSADKVAESFLDEVRELAAELGRNDVVHALETSSRRSHRARPVVEAVERLRRCPVVWRWEDCLERLVLRLFRLQSA